MARFQTPGVLLVCGEHPIITTRPEIMLAMSAEDKKKLDRFQRLHPPHFDCDTSKDDKDFLDRCHQMHCNLGLVKVQWSGCHNISAKRSCLVNLILLGLSFSTCFLRGTSHSPGGMCLEASSMIFSKIVC